MKKIVFLNTSHYSKDDRVYYHQSKSLNNSEYQVIIISTKEELKSESDGIIINSYDDYEFSQKDKISKIIEQLNLFLPDLIICDSPIAVIASAIFKKKKTVKIIYDITEWYPSKKNLHNYNTIKKISKFFILAAVNLYAGIKTDNFIFGEYYKSIPFKYLFFWKPFINLPYYPNLKYINYYPLNKLDTEINFFYSGLISDNKGIYSILNALNVTAKKFPSKHFNLQIIGYFGSVNEQNKFERVSLNLEQNIQISIQGIMPFPEFCKVIGKADIFLDLRKKNIENTHCLPIKLFYYLACGRPVIYSNIRSIKHEMKTFNFGHITDPDNSNLIAKQISNYITTPEIYEQHAYNALTASREKYNWDRIENQFVTFIKNCI